MTDRADRLIRAIYTNHQNFLAVEPTEEAIDAFHVWLQEAIAEYLENEEAQCKTCGRKVLDHGAMMLCPQ